MKALILIGGEGTRLRPLTYKTLKCMVPVANRPFFEYQIALLKKYGITEIILSVCYMPDKVQKAIGNGKKFGVKIIHVREKTPLGTAGAIKNAEKHLDDTTVIMNGDILTDIKIDAMLDAHKAAGAAVTIALHEIADPSAFGLVMADENGRVREFIEKPKQAQVSGNWINAGIYIFDKKALEMIPAGKQVSVEREAFPALIKQGKTVASYKTDAYWLDTGKIEHYKQANFDVLSGKFDSPFGTPEIKKTGILKGVKTVIKTNTILSAPVIIGEKCVIGKNVKISGSIIWNNVKIGDNAVIKNSIVGNKCVIADGVVLDGAVLQDSSRVKE